MILLLRLLLLPCGLSLPKGHKAYIQGNKLQGAYYKAPRVPFKGTPSSSRVHPYNGPEVGVPQGSVLRPLALLHDMYVNDLCNAVSRSRVTQYADDTNVIVKSKGTGKFLAKADYAVKSVLDCFEADRLMVDVSKTRFIVFGSKTNVVSSLGVSWKIIAR
jgi:hypothetical protein